VSVLNEMCSKRRWQPPRFELMEEVGPAHHKMFRFKVQFITVYISSLQILIYDYDVLHFHSDFVGIRKCTFLDDMTCVCVLQVPL